MKTVCELKVEDLRCTCAPSVFNFKSTAEIDPLEDVIGQKRAVQAIDFGLNMDSPGYNIFVTGQAGTGKTTIVNDIVGNYARALPTPDDWCMVNNFQDRYRPRAIRVPPGKAMLFSKQMSRLVDVLKIRLPEAYDDKAFQEQQAAVRDKYQQQEKTILANVAKMAGEKSLAISRTPEGYQVVPLVEGKPVTNDEFTQLPDAEQKKLEAEMQVIQDGLKATVGEVNTVRQEMASEQEALVDQVARRVVTQRMAHLVEAYKECPAILAYLEEVKAELIENVEDFMPEEKEDNPMKAMFMPPEKPSFQRYLVNALVDQTDTRGAPVIFEPNPTYLNIFGRIEKRAHMGAATTDFTMVQAGSLLQANGGYLIMEIESIVTDQFAWESLKRALQNKKLYIEDVPAGMGFANASLKPEPIPLDVKVILLGDYEIFQALQNYDSKFNKIFKVRADFDHEVVRTDKTVQQYAKFIARVCKQEQLLPFSPGGVAAIVEFGEKIIANKNKLSLRFGPIVGILKEADYWTGKAKATLITEKFVVKAFQEYRFRYNLYEEKVHESYVDETILIDVDGAVTGQINGLAVFQIGDLSFGRPSRITAETFMGRKGIVNIEREAGMSGNTHNKGVLILSGFLGRTFAQGQPLTLSASITFEQSYSGVDGDSASSTELYAVLSSLSDIPLDQGIAVTGSVNQKGKIQAIGGVNQKIEGFFDVCETKGLTGRQGVIIPEANVQNLMLSKKVVDAVARGEFHIYSITTIEQGIEILTGLPAGAWDINGKFPEGTVFGGVQKKLGKYMNQALKFKNTEKFGI
ncbi:MAG: AAA family ATPase [Desulfobacterales bacterium]|nr:AAA family ATPase [Desulfobacterales bacterium]